jgi:uncharacterized protein YndB with AHSA1/START domain
VWELVADPAGLETWLCDEADLPAVEPGAEGVVREGAELRHVTVEEVDAGRRVALSWCAPDGDPSIVELTLDDEEDGRTRLVVVEVPLLRLRLAGRVLATSAESSRGPLALAR